MAKNELKDRINLLWGEEDFTLDKAVKKLRSKVVDDAFSSLSHKKLTAPDVQTLTEAIETTPMMFGNLLIEVQANSLFLRGQKKSNTSDKQLNDLIYALENLNENIHVLFICKIPRGTNKKIDSVAKLTKTIKKIGTVEEFPAFKSYQDDKVISWIKNWAKQEKIEIDNVASKQLFINIGVDLRKLNTELHKLKTAIHPKKNITKEDVSNLCSEKEDIFILSEYWLQKDKQKAIQELNKLFEKDHPIRIITTIQSILQRWIRVKIESESKSAFEISKIINKHEFIVKQDINKLSKTSIAELVKFKENLTTTEFKIKKGILPAELALEMMFSS